MSVQMSTRIHTQLPAHMSAHMSIHMFVRQEPSQTDVEFQAAKISDAFQSVGMCI